MEPQLQPPQFTAPPESNQPHPPVESTHHKRPWLWAALAFVLIVGAGIYWGLRTKNIQPDTSKTNQITQDTAKNSNISDLSLANNYFGLNLMRKISLSDGNIFISPTSISAALTLAANGAEGETLTEMLQVLGLDKIGLEQANLDYQQKMEQFNVSTDDLQISLANSIWTTGNNSFLPQYSDLADKYFSAKAAKATSVKDINGWVAGKTHDKIQNILDDLDSDLYLVNAIYFKSNWQSPFEEADTKEENFQTATSQVQVEMMNKTQDLDYYSDSTLQAVKLPYHKDSDGVGYSMMVILPAKSSSLADLVSDLDYQRYQKITRALSESLVELKLPKFEMDYKADLIEKLRLMGMQLAFNGDKGGFTKMSSSPQVINKVIHQSYVKVDEQGTEAAAATVVGMDTFGAITEPPKTVQMYVDRPFFFAIQNDETGEILFSGAIQNPTE